MHKCPRRFLICFNLYLIILLLDTSSADRRGCSYGKLQKLFMLRKYKSSNSFNLIFRIFNFQGIDVVSSSMEDKLRHDLLPNYIRTIIPVLHNELIHISLSLHMNHLKIEEKSGTATLYGQLRANWMDRKLIWNKQDYGNIDTLHLSSDDIWIPDLALYNNAGNNLIDFHFKGYCKVESNGRVTWTPQVKLESYCDLDHKYWPFDSQTCSFIMGSWVHHGFQMNITLPDNKPIIKEFVENHEWKIIDTHSFREDKIYACCAEPYPTYTFTFDIERRSAMLKTLILTPAFSLTLMCLIGFWLPPHRGEKIILNCMNILILSMFMFYFIKRIPAFANHVPLVVIYYTVTYVLLTISMVVSTLILLISKSLKSCNKIPQNLKRLFQSKFGNFLGVAEMGSSIKDQTELKDHFEDRKSGEDRCLIKQDNFEDDWIMLATGIDRIFFYCFCIVFLLTAAICFI